MKRLLFSLFLFLSLQVCQSQQPPSLTFNHQAILVKNMDQSVAFYHVTLGLPEIEDKTEQPHIRWFSMGDNKELHLISDASAPEPPAKGIHMALNTTQLDELIAHLKKNNIPFENWMGEAGTTNTRPDGIRQIYLQDPDGYWIEINGR